jgi:enoyl-CoA hydratase
MSTDILEPPGLIVTIESQGVAVVKLNRPGKRNALSQGLIDELTGTLSQLNRSPTVLAVVITSSGPFCGMNDPGSTANGIGTDMNQPERTSENCQSLQRLRRKRFDVRITCKTSADFVLARHRIDWLKDLGDAFASFQKPVLAAVRGFAVNCPCQTLSKSNEICSSVVVSSSHSW